MASERKLTFEDALDRAGYGPYSYLITGLNSCILLSLICTAYSTSIIVPTSACELETTGAQRGALAAVPIVGLTFGSMVCGYLADTYGRKPTLLVSLVSAAVVNALASISVNWVMLMCLQLTSTTLASGQYSVGMSLLSESVPMAKRNIVVLIVANIYLLSQGIMSVIAMPIIPLTFSYYLPALDIFWNSWRTLMLVYSIPSILSALWLYFMYESPKFLYAKGRDTEAVTVLQKIHKMNVKSGEILRFDGLVLHNPVDKKNISVTKQILSVFRPPLLKNTIPIILLFVFQQVGAFMVWLPTIVNQFVQIVETGEGTNLTLCDILRSSVDAIPNPDEVPCALNVTTLLIILGVGAVHAFSNMLITMIINRIGRRNMVIAITGVSGALGIIVNLIPNAIGSAVLFCGFTIGMLVMGLYSAIVVTAYPTHLRAFAFAFTSSCNLISNFAVIQLLNFLLENNCELGFYIFCTLFASTAIVAAFLDNDRTAQALKLNRSV